MIKEWPENIKHSYAALTLTSNTRFEKGKDGLLCNDKKEIFHCATTKGIFVAGCSQPDITPTITALSGQVRSPKQNDWEKCQ